MLLCSGPENGRFLQKSPATGGLTTVFYPGNTEPRGGTSAKEQVAVDPFLLEKRLT